MADVQFFVSKGSIVRRIWGKPDIILFIFAGAAAEFALNKAVDWLYFTGRLPTDPLGRLFSTVSYARKIVFSEKNQAHAAIDNMRDIHTALESARGKNIPDWAYRDVLFMLIHYSIASFELLDRKLTIEEKEETVSVFIEVARRMGIKDLPIDFKSWSKMYAVQLKQDFEYGEYTKDLFKQYRRQLGAVRYFALLEIQKLLVPEKVRQLLEYKTNYLIRLPLFIYRQLHKRKLEWPVISLFLPKEYRNKVKALYSYQEQ